MAVLLRNGHTHETHHYTTVDHRHRHHVATISGRALVRSDGSHVHLISSWTTHDHHHIHAVRRYTGPGIPIGDGMHIHRIHAHTSVKFQHHHRISGTTMMAHNIPAVTMRAAMRAQ